MVADCTARCNGGEGFVAFSGSTVRHCTATSNTLDGFRVSTNVTVTDCTAQGQGTATGIHTTGADNRIDSNQVLDNASGILADTTGSLFIRNSASGNTTAYAIPAGNDVGPIGSAATATSRWASIAF